MKTIDEQIELIKTLLEDGGLNPTGIEIIMEELSTLIQKEREEAVRGFIDYIEQTEKKEKIDGWIVSAYDYKKTVTEDISSYLSQTKGGKDDKH